MEDVLEKIQQKILTVENEDIEKLRHFWSFHNKKVVFTNGCFDIIHRGHVEYLAKAASQGHILIVGLNNDGSVKKVKGENRPVQDEYSRAMALAAMSFVTNVILFEEDTPYNLIKIVKPDILVKGGDYTEDEIIGSDLVKSRNGEVVSIPLIQGYSTSSILKQIKSEL